MKKLLFLLLCAAIPAIATTNKFSEAQITGRWQCVTEYSGDYFIAKTDDTVTLHADHLAENAGKYTFTFRAQELTFRYEQLSRGNWKLDGDTLSLTWRDGPLTPAHDPKIQELIATSPKVRKLEQEISAILKPDGKAEADANIILRIDSIEGNTMQQTQLESAGGPEMAKTVCTRL